MGQMMLRRIEYRDPDTGYILRAKERFVDVQWDEEKGYLFWNRKAHTKLFNDVDFPDEMTFADRGRMATLAKKVWRDTNMLAYRGNGGIKPYGIEHIAKVIKTEKRQAYNFVEKMIRLGMMAKVKVETDGRQETHYYLSPIHFCSTNRINLNLYLLFREQLDAVLPDWVKIEFMKKKNEVETNE